MKILGTKDPAYINWQKRKIANIHNGAHYYGREIEELILPHIKANVFVVVAGGTIRPRSVPDNCVFVCHHNLSPERMYEQFLGKNILWVCSKPSTVKKMLAAGEKAVYIPLSNDDDGKGTPVSFALLDFVGNFLGIVGDFGDEDGIGCARDASVEGDPACITPHHFHDDDALVGRRCGVEAI
jgi:hypothetical protein